MKNKKGFTLIELLAILVILAIIALIAIPVVLNIIDKVRESSYERSVENILNAARIYHKETKIDPTMTREGNVYDEVMEMIGGRKPDSGEIYIKKSGEIAISLKYDKYCYTKKYEENVFRKSEGETCESPIKTYAIGDPVYFNPVENRVCDEKTEYTETNSQTGVKTGCMRWYVYKENEENYGLILDHNTTGKVKWISEKDYGCGEDGAYCANNDKGPITLEKQLKIDTEDQKWQVKADIVDAMDIVKLIPYFSNVEDIETLPDYIGDYWEAYNVAFEDAMTSVSPSEYSTIDEYIDALLDYMEEKYPNMMLPRGLYRDMFYEGYMESITGTEASTYGYWTKTPVAGNSYIAWDCVTFGTLYNYTVDYGDNNGLRPVISVSKSTIQ